MYIQKPYRGNCLSSHSRHFVRKNLNQTPLKAVVGVDQPMKAISMHIIHEVVHGTEG